MRTKIIAFLCPQLLVLTVGLWAQVDTGVITGTVTDQQQAVLPKVLITLTNQATEFAARTYTNSEGIFVSPPLRPGRYEITAELQGFQKAVTTLALEINQRAVIDLRLPVGQVAESVEVVAEAPLLERESSAIGNVVSERALKELPLNLRNVTKLFELGAGTVPVNTQAQGLPITQARGVAMVSVNGVPGQQNNILVEGINNTENHNGTGVVVYPPLDALAEFKVQTSVSDAQFGRAAGGILNLTMKSGSRDFHGNFFEFLRNSALDAKNFFDPQGSPARFIMNQFGATFGGPVWIPGLYNRERKKTFFFTSYEGIRRTQSQTLISTVPLPETLRGDFTNSPFRIYDPLTTRPAASGSGFGRDPFPGNVILANRIDRVGRNVADLYPRPTQAGLANNFVYSPVRTLNTDNGDIKIDHYASASDWITFRFSRGITDVFEPPALPPPAVGSGPGFPGTFHQPHVQGMLSYTRVFSPSMFNEVRFGISRLSQISRHITYGRYLAEELGVPGVNIPGDELTSGNLSTVSVAGYQALGDAGFLPAVVVSDNFQIGDNLSVVRGRHSLKLGLEVHRRRYNAFQSTTPRGTVTFGRIFTTNPAASAGTGEGVADLLLGVPQTSTIQIINGTRGQRRTEYTYYLQDNFKMTGKLTLNLGLRYDIYAGWPWTEVGDRQAQFLLDRGAVYPVGSSEVPSRSGTETDYNNFSPRVGLAYAANPRTTLRAAYGVFYPVGTWDVNSNLAANPPFVGRLTYANDQFDFLGARRLSQGFDRPATFPTLGASLSAVRVDIKTPSVQQWNLNIQRQLPGDVLFTAAYVGTKGTNLLYARNINLPVPGPTPVASRRPYPQYADIQFLTSEASSSYHSLQLTAEKRFSRGLSFLGAYTWGHCISDGESVQNPRDRRNDRGNCGLDLRQRFVFSYNYELPFGRGKTLLANMGRVGEGILGGWQMNGILNLYSGFPFTPSSAINTLNSPGSSQRAHYISGCEAVLPPGQRALDRYFNTACFSTPPQFTFGNAGPNILSGPGTAQFDFSVFKNLRWGSNDNRYAQVRGEFFNITNTPQFNNPNASIGSASAGTIRSAGSVLTFSRTQRQIQLSVKLFF